MKSENKVKPMFKYIGGKSWLGGALRDRVRKFRIMSKDSIGEITVDCYIEPFCGGLGAFLAVHNELLYMGIKKVILNDINKDLIDFYCDIYKKDKKLLKRYMLIENEFTKLIPKNAYSLHRTNDKVALKKLLKQANDFYYQVKDAYNIKKKDLKSKDTVDKSAMLLFLQNHCFNGVHRENQKGEYNTPFNWDHKVYTNDIIKEKIDTILNVFKKFDEVIFSNKSYDELEFNHKQFIYCDPPYLNNNIPENRYSKRNFNTKDQLRLIDMISPYVFLYSNHKHDELIERFDKNTKYLSVEVKRKNTISSNSETRKKDKVELLILKSID